MKDFKELGSTDFRYFAYLKEDNKTFVHLSMYANEAVQQKLLDMESFKIFQLHRDNSGLEVAPKIERMELVDSSHTNLY